MTGKRRGYPVHNHNHNLNHNLTPNRNLRRKLKRKKTRNRVGVTSEKWGKYSRGCSIARKLFRKTRTNPNRRTVESWA